MLPSILITDKQGIHTYDLVSEAFEKRRRIYLTRPIDDSLASEIILQLEYLDKVSDADIIMYINSPGGSVSAGLAVIDAMRRCRSEIVTVCTGMAASMASVILCCGSKGKRYVTPLSEVMIHQPLGGTSGQASDIERAAKHIAHTKDILMKLLSETTGQTTERVIADCDRDSYFSADEAVNYGLADSILTKML